MTSTNKNIFKIGFFGLGWASTGLLIVSLFQILQISILSRYLDKVDFGLIAMCMVVVQFCNSLVGLGLNSALLHFKNVKKSDFSSLYWFNLFFSFFIYSVVVLLTPIISDFYNEIKLNKILPIISINIVLLSIGMLHKTMFEKTYKFKIISIIDMISALAGFLGCLIFIKLDFGIYSFIIATLVASFTNSLLTLFKSFKIFGLQFVFNFVSLYKFLKIGFYNMSGSILDFMSREFDILIIGKLLGSEVLGIYSLSKLIVVKIYAIINPLILKVFTPIIASIQNNKLKLKNLYLKLISSTTIINSVIYLFILIFSKEIIFLMFGEKYVSGYFILNCLATAYFINSISSPISSLQIATGRTDIGFYWTIFRIVITVLVLYTAASLNENIMAISLIGLAIFFIFPLWIYQIKRFINVSFIGYINEFYKSFVLFSIFGLTVFFTDYYNIFIKESTTIFFKSFLFVFALFLTFLTSKNKIVELKDKFKNNIK